MHDLEKTLNSVRQRIGKYRKARRINEENTKATLIEPVLRALGWDVEDMEEVNREFKVKRRDRPVDYALLLLRNPRLLVEAKALGEDLNDRRWSNQIMGYAAVAGVEWTVLTDGDEYRVYNSHAAVAVDEKLFRSVKISDPSTDPAETLGLLSKDHMAENRLEVLWRAHFVDRQVRSAIEQLFAAESDMALVNWLEQRTKELTVPEIRASLGRCRVELDFPLTYDTASSQPAGPIPKRKRGGRRHGAQKPTSLGGRSDVTPADLIAEGILRAPLDLHRSYKGHTLRARIEADGSVTFGGEQCSSLSTAAGMYAWELRACVDAENEFGLRPGACFYHFYFLEESLVATATPALQWYGDSYRERYEIEEFSGGGRTDVEAGLAAKPHGHIAP